MTRGIAMMVVALIVTATGLVGCGGGTDEPTVGTLAIYDANSLGDIRPLLPEPAKMYVHGGVELAPVGVDVVAFDPTGWTFEVVAGTAEQRAPGNEYNLDTTGVVKFKAISPTGQKYNGCVTVFS